MVNSVNRRRASRKKNTYGMGSGVTKQSNTANRRKRKSPSSVVASPSKSRQTNEAKSQANMRALRAKTVTAKKTSPASSKFGVGSGKFKMHKGKKMANVSKEQLNKTGMSLRAYMNSWNKTGKRPT